MLLTADGRTLLLSSPAGTIADARMWHMPGGRIESGETAATCAAREAREETGIDLDPSSLELIWTRETDVRLPSGAFHQVEEYYLARIEQLEVSAEGRDAAEGAYIDGHRWMTSGEIAAEQARGVLVAPPDLAARLGVLAEFGPPGVPSRIAGSAEDYPRDQLERNVHAAAIWWSGLLGMTGSLGARFEKRLADAIRAELESRTSAGRPEVVLVEYELASLLIDKIASELGVSSAVHVPFGASTRISREGVMAAPSEDDPLTSFIQTHRALSVSTRPARQTDKDRGLNP